MANNKPDLYAYTIIETAGEDSKDFWQRVGSDNRRHLFALLLRESRSYDLHIDLNTRLTSSHGDELCSNVLNCALVNNRDEYRCSPSTPRYAFLTNR